MDTVASACLEPKWTSLRGMPGDSMEVLRDKHARLSLIAKAYKLRLAQLNSHLPTAIPLPLPLDSEGVVRLNGQASESSAKHPPPLHPVGRKSAADISLTCASGLGRIPSSGRITNAILAAARPHLTEICKLQQRSEVGRPDFQHASIYEGVHPPVTSNTSVAVSDSSHGAEGLCITRPGQLELLDGMGRGGSEGNFVHGGEGGGTVSPVADISLVRPVVTVRPSLQQQPGGSSERNMEVEVPLRLWQRMRGEPCHASLSFWEGTGQLPQSEGDEWNGAKDLQAAAGLAVQGMQEHTAAVLPMPSPAFNKQPLVSCIQQSGSGPQVQPPRVPYTQFPTRESSVVPLRAGVGVNGTIYARNSPDAAIQPVAEPTGDSTCLASGDGDVMGSRSEAAAAELEAEAGEAPGRGEGDDDDVMYVGSALGDPAAYGDWLQAQGNSQRHRGPSRRRGGTQNPPSSRPDQPSKQRSILNFIQSRPCKQSIGSERVAASGTKRTGSGYRRSGRSLPHGQRFSQVLHPWTTTASQPRGQQMADTMVASAVAQMQGAHEEGGSASTSLQLSHGRLEAARPRLDQGGERGQARGQDAKSPAPRQATADSRPAEAVVPPELPPFRTMQLQPQPQPQLPSQPLILQPIESDPGNAGTFKGCSGAVLPRRGSGSLSAHHRAGSDSATAAAMITMTEPARNCLPCVTSVDTQDVLSRAQPPSLPPLLRMDAATEPRADLGLDRANRNSDVNEDDSILPACQPVHDPTQLLWYNRVVIHSNGIEAHTVPVGRTAASVACLRVPQARSPAFAEETTLADGILRQPCKKLQGPSLEVAPAAQAEADVLPVPVGPSSILGGSEAAAAGSLSMRALVDVAPGGTEAPLPCIDAGLGPQIVEGQHRHHHQEEQQLQQLNFATPRCVQVPRAQVDTLRLRLDHHLYSDVGNGGDGAFVPASHDDSTELLATASEEYVVPATPMSLAGSEAGVLLSVPKSVPAAGRGRASAAHTSIRKATGSAIWSGQSPHGDWTALRQRTRAIHGAAAVVATPLPASRVDSHLAVVTAVASTPMVLASTSRDSGAVGELDSCIITPVPSLLGPRGTSEAGADGPRISAAFAGVEIPDVPAAAADLTDFIGSPRVAYYGRCQGNSGVGSHDELIHPGRVLQVQVAVDIGSSEDVLDRMKQYGSSEGGLPGHGDTVAAHAGGRACYVTCVVVKNTAPGGGLPTASSQGGLRRNVMDRVNGADSVTEPVCCTANEADNQRSGGRRQPLMLYTWRLPPDGPPVLHSTLALTIAQPKAPTAMAAAAATTPPEVCGGAPADLDAACEEQNDGFMQLGYSFRLLVTADGGLSLVLSSAVNAPALMYEGGITVSDGPLCLQDKFRDPHNSGKRWPEGQGDPPASPVPSLLEDLRRHRRRDERGDEAVHGDIVGHVKLLRFQGGAWRLIRVLHGPAEIYGGGGGPAVCDVATLALRCLACTACSVLSSPPLSGAWGRDTEACPASSQTAQRMHSCWQIVAGGQAGRGCVWRLDPSLEAVLHCELLPSVCCVAGQHRMTNEVVEVATLPHRPRLVLGTVADGCLALWDVGIARAVVAPAAVADGAIGRGHMQGPVSGHGGHGAVATVLRLTPAVPAVLLTVVRPERCVLRCLQPVAVSVPGGDQRTHEGGCAEMEACGGRGSEDSRDQCGHPGLDNYDGCMDRRRGEFAPVSFLARACEIPSASAGRAAVDGFGDELCTAACVTPVILSKDSVEVGRGLAAGVTCLSAWAGLGAVGTEQGKVLAWDCKQGVLVAGWQLPTAVSAVAVNSRMVFAAAGGRLLLGRVDSSL
ncbi:hypothetical protein Vafri_19543 [Volvox africanus]|uniref:Uncharacterized protein n=1 Tax=Volvox africanus TaxID=51714 RepID=A0A8J4BV32_9CHLO|nr:hypothetical protein Vafri_19543 [Volvox africanus]